MEVVDRALPVTRGQLDIWLAQETGHSSAEVSGSPNVVIVVGRNCRQLGAKRWHSPGFLIPGDHALTSVRYRPWVIEAAPGIRPTVYAAHCGPGYR
jgi:hypothetical protein